MHCTTALLVLLCTLALAAMTVSHAAMSTSQFKTVQLKNRYDPLPSANAMRTTVKSLNSKGMETQTQVSLLKGCASVAFSTPIIIGTQTFDVLVDTGSTTLAVASDQCGSKCAENGLSLSPAYTPDPVGAQDQQQTITSTYGSGSWSGRTFRDSVSLAGYTPISMVLAAIDSSTTFFRTSNCQNTFNQANTYQGILGLGFSSLAVAPTDSYLDSLYTANSGAYPDIFAIQMCLLTGRLWIGGYDDTFLDPNNIQYTPLLQEAWYVVGMKDIKFNGVSIGPQTYGTTIVDSGTTLLLLPDPAYQAFTTAIQANANFQRYFGPDFFSQNLCKSVPGLTTDQLNNELPTMEITLDTATLTLNAISSYLLQQSDETGTVYYCSGLSDGGATAATGSVSTILGYAAINQHTVIYDRQSKRIGFSPTKYCDVDPPASTFTSWYSSGWTTCAPTVAGDASTCTQTRTVTCKDSNAVTVPDSACPGTKPVLSQSCHTFAGTCYVDTSSGARKVWMWVGIGIGIILVICLCVLCIRCCCAHDDKGDIDRSSPSRAVVYNDQPGLTHLHPSDRFTPLVVDQGGQYVGGTVGANASNGERGRFVVVPIQSDGRYGAAAHSQPQIQRHDAASRISNSSYS